MEHRVELEMTMAPPFPTNAQVRHILEEMVEQLHYEDRRYPPERYQINGHVRVEGLEGRFLAVFALSLAAD